MRPFVAAMMGMWIASHIVNTVSSAYPMYSILLLAHVNLDRVCEFLKLFVFDNTDRIDDEHCKQRGLQ